MAELACECLFNMYVRKIVRLLLKLKYLYININETVHEAIPNHVMTNKIKVGAYCNFYCYDLANN